MSVIAILGPTASGKSAVAEAAATEFGASILSVDSMQVFRGMDIGTAKPSIATRDRITHHMIDVADPANDYSVVDYQREGRHVIRQAELQGERIIMAGGSGMHFRSIVDPMTFSPTDPAIRRELESKSLVEIQDLLLNIDPDASDVVDMHNPRRVIRAIEIWRITSQGPSERAASAESEDVRRYVPFIDHVSIGVDAGRKSSDRIEARLTKMIQDGLFDEVRDLAPLLGRTASQAVGYRELLDVVAGTSDIDSARAKTVRATNALVKRQRTFFRRDPRVEWIPWQDDEDERIASAVNRVGEVAGWIS